jgi:UDP-N-acetylmuramyl-tripeptide synthetase
MPAPAAASSHAIIAAEEGIAPVSLYDLLLKCSEPMHVLQGSAQARVGGITADSRQVTPGALFAALSGSKSNGSAFAVQAVERGASVLLMSEEEARRMAVPQGVTLLASEHPRRALAQLAAAFFAVQPEFVLAVTGTDGKTSTTDFARQLLDLSGLKAASLGTIGARSASLNLTLETGHTTPDPVTLHRQLRQLALAGAQAVAMEASSHGLDQARLDGVKLSAVAFTNLGRDHLDYHPDEEAYFHAKRHLFAELLPEGAVAAINIEDPRGAELCELVQARGGKLITYGRGSAHLDVIASTPVASGLELTLGVEGALLPPMVVPLMGGFQAMNALAACGLVHGCGIPLIDLVMLLPQLQGVRGRMERVALHRGGSVIVDYAHTPRALETVLNALRPHTQGKLRVIFGCGGDRDTGKRPLMGEVAARLADAVIVADDNPRSEDPALIRAAVMAGCPNAENIGDRKAAIAAGLAALGEGDVLLIAGKGHETTQTIGTEVLEFDDAAVVRALIGEGQVNG